MITFPATLRFRLMVFALAVFVPMVGLVLYGDWEQSRSATAEARSKALRLVQLAAAEQEQFAEAARQFLVALAHLPIIKDADKENCDYFLSEVLSAQPAYSNLGVIMVDGRVLCSAVSSPGISTLDLSGRSYFQRAMNTRQFAVGDYQIGRVTGKPVIIFAHPELNDEGEVAYLVAAALDLKWFNEFVGRFSLPEKATLTVFSSDGTILARHPEPESWMGRAMPEAPLIRTALQREDEGIVEARGDDGVERLYACRPLKGAVSMTATACIGIPMSVAYSEVKRTTELRLVWLGVAAFFTLAVGWFIGDRFILKRIHELIQATRRLSAGELTARTGLPYDGGELGELARSFDEMAATLQKRYEERVEAEASLREALAENAKMLDVLLQKGIQFKALTVRLAEVEENEKRRLSHELHDRVGQTLTALGLNLNIVETLLSGDVSPAVKKRLDDSMELLEETVKHIRDVMANLSPPVLDKYGLPAALRWYGERLSERSGLSVVVQADEPLRRLPASHEIALYRLIQEALNNVIRHAKARTATITLEELDEGILRLTVADDGVGFEADTFFASSPSGPPQARLHWGFVTMRERAEMANGRFHVESAPGEGTRVVVDISR